MATCPHCANEIDDGARFCGVCGRPITQTAEAAAARRDVGRVRRLGVASRRRRRPRCRRRCRSPRRRRLQVRAPAPVHSSPNVMTMNRSGPSPRPRRRPPRPRAGTGRAAACADPRAGAAAREPDRPHPEPPLHRRGQDRRGRLRRRVPGQADRDRPRGGAQDPPPAQRARRDDRRALPARGGGVLEAARPAHRHHLRLRRDARRHPVPGDGAAARAAACTTCRRPTGRWARRACCASWIRSRRR